MTKDTINKSSWSDEQIELAKTIWEEYQNEHNLSDQKGRVAGIDPVTREVWIGDDIAEIGKTRREQGLTSQLFFERIGYPTVYRKGGRR